jgi:hypothetical protein
MMATDASQNCGGRAATRSSASTRNRSWGLALAPPHVAREFLARGSQSMRIFLDPYWWTLGLGSLVQLVLFVRWLYRRIRNDELTRAFVEDMATNHLPHIYDRLERLCDEQGIERDPSPPIRWVDLNSRSH